VNFEELNINKALLNALHDLDYMYPTPIQKEAFSVVMSGRNMIGVAQTGTGKTFAYLLPILRMLKFSKQRDPRILILAPTHELVIQIVNEINKLTTYSNLRALAIFGGGNINKQKQAVYDGTDILVATPGRLLDIAYTGILSLKSIQKLVIDEVDEMLSLGFRTQINSIFGILPPKRQNLMFSATLSPDVEKLISNAFDNAVKVEVASHGTPLERIIQKAYYVPNFNTKVNLLEEMLLQEDFKKVLVFVKTKKLADRLYEQINFRLPDKLGVIHSNKAHNTRLNAVKNFENENFKALIATDIIARGMDLADVSHVINFDLPETQGDYMHRIGRTGRADNDGIAISFINEVEEEYQQNIEEMMRMEIPIFDLPDTVEISDEYSEEDKPKEKPNKQLVKAPSINQSKGAFHEKSDKNKKKNSGSASRHKAKYKKSGKKIKYSRKR